MSPLARTPPVSPVRPAGSFSRLRVMREQTQSQQKICFLLIFIDWREWLSSAFPGRCKPLFLLLPLPAASWDPAAGAHFPRCQHLRESFPWKGRSWLAADTEQEVHLASQGWCSCWGSGNSARKGAGVHWLRSHESLFLGRVQGVHQGEELKG